MTAVRVAENRYKRRLVAIVKGVQASYMNVLEPHLGDVAQGFRTDAHPLTRWRQDLDRLDARIKENIQTKTGEAFDEMQRRVNKENFQAAKKLLGITPSPLAQIDIQHIKNENIALVENAARVYAQDVRDIFSDPNTLGMSVDELKKKLLERGNVNDSRAELIARDQTLKLNGALNEKRQKDAGVTEYVWSTSKDDRVREEHRELDGQTFSWSNPPEPGHPGEDFQCRCVALPVVTELEGIF